MIIEKKMKVPSGKKVVVKATVIGQKIKELRLTGDFFLHPEESVEFLENVMRDSGQIYLKDDLLKAVEENSIKLVGITIDALISLMEEIYKEIGPANPEQKVEE